MGLPDQSLAFGVGRHIPVREALQRSWDIQGVDDGLYTATIVPPHFPSLFRTYCNMLPHRSLLPMRYLWRDPVCLVLLWLMTQTQSVACEW